MKKVDEQKIKVDINMFLFGFEILEYLWDVKNYSYDDRLNEINIRRILPSTKKVDILSAINNCLFLRDMPQLYKSALCRFVKAVFIDNEYKPILDTEFTLKALEVKEFRHVKKRNKHMLQKALFNNYASFKKSQGGLVLRATGTGVSKLADGKLKK